MLTHEQLLQEVSYDPKTGEFVRLVKRSANASLGPIKGHPVGAGYLAFSVCGRDYYMHRLAWFFVRGSWPEHNIDHINGVRTDNRIANLRDVPQSLNMQNVRKPKAYSSTGILGVSRFRSGYRAEIRIDGKKKHLGVFDTPEKAHEAYMAAKHVHHPACSF
jgi:hypothetical protein